jgi:hypothetical protein
MATLQEMEQWAVQYLNYVGIGQPTQGQVESITAQEIHEGSDVGLGGTTDPLNAINPATGVIGPFPTVLAGIQSTAATMEANDPNLIQTLKQSPNDPQAYFTALQTAQWEGLNSNPIGYAGNQAYGPEVEAVWADTFGGGQNVPTTTAPNLPATTTTTDPTTGAVTVTPTLGFRGSDPFTNVMVNLDKLMNPHPSGGLLSVLNPTSYLEVGISLAIRGGLALGFLAVGAVGLIKAASGGQLKASQIPGMAAGFMAGPEAGLMNVLGHMGAGGAVSQRRFGQRRELAQGQQAISAERTAISGRRQALTEAVTPGREARAEGQQQVRLQRETRQQAAQDVKVADMPRRANLAERAQRTAAGRLNVRRREVKIKEAREAREAGGGRRSMRIYSAPTQDDVSA